MRDNEIMAASAELADIQAAVNACIGDIDTVLIPAGTVNWSGPLKIPRAITIKGNEAEDISRPIPLE